MKPGWRSNVAGSYPPAVYRPEPRSFRETPSGLLAPAVSWVFCLPGFAAMTEGEPGATGRTDDGSGYRGLAAKGYEHRPTL